MSCWLVSLKCLLVREQCEENKVVSKCRAERAAGLGDGTVCGGEEKSLKEEKM